MNKQRGFFVLEMAPIKGIIAILIGLLVGNPNGAPHGSAASVASPVAQVAQSLR